MEANLFLLIGSGVLIACGVYLMLDKSMTRMIMGVTLIGNGANLLLLQSGGPAGSPPIIGRGSEAAADGADPLAQAMILTAIGLASGQAFAQAAWSMTGLNVGVLGALIYDSMIGKLIVYGDTREQALARMRTALDETVVEGIQTNIPLHRELMVDAKFIEGGTSIHYLEVWMAERKR